MIIHVTRLHQLIPWSDGCKEQWHTVSLKHAFYIETSLFK